MGVKSSIGMFAGCVLQAEFMGLVLLVGLSVFQGDHGLTASAQSRNEASLYLDQKESAVKEVARSAALNNDNCGSLNGCSAACTRVTCYPVNGEMESLQCTTVDNNEFFNVCPPGSCKNMILVDYSRSYVILPAPASTKLSTEVARDICLQRKLDSTFKTVSFPSEYNLVYFGSTSGAFRAFPGRERNETQCKTFDPRRRPWYLNGISVSKDVKILVDVANTMGSVVTVDFKRLPQTTYLDVAKDITRGLLQTFSPQDYVEVFSFDSSNVTSLVGAVQIGSSYNYLDPAGRPELASLGASVDNLAVSSNAALSNLTGAISQAINSFKTTDKLKVIVVLSDGHFVPLNRTSFPSLEIQNLHIKLMVYKLPPNDENGDPYMLRTPSLQENICSVNGSFERLNPLETVNPLYSMRSYFSFLARTQLASVNDTATWSNLYLSFSQDRSATTVTYPVFGSDGLLIGVVGLDVVIDNLKQPLQDMVYAEYQSRAKGTRAPANIPMTCNYSSTPANAICSSSTPPDSSAICPGSSTSTLASHTCCGDNTCSLRPPPKKLPAWAIAVISISSIVVVAAVVFAIKRGCRSRSEPNGQSNSPAARPLTIIPEEGTQSTVKDHVDNCVLNVRNIQTLSRVENLLNRGQCQDLSTKLSNTMTNVQELLSLCETSSSFQDFKYPLKTLLLNLEKAKVLVIQCGELHWWRASIFQSQNENAFREILLDVGLCYNMMYEQAKTCIGQGRNLPGDLRNSSEFKSAPQQVIDEDRRELQVRLEELSNERGASEQQCLARYVLAKLNHTFEQSGTHNLDICNTTLWTRDRGLPTPWTWRDQNPLLGNGVCKTSWMDIPCAKKVFNEPHLEPIFLNEASILAHLKHPCIVNFICCGNGAERGNRFIATELMEMSLADLIANANNGTVHLSIHVVVDIMVQMARGMCYLHGQGIAHRDIKPQNVVVTKLTSSYNEDHYYAKLVDFGMSKTKVQASKSSSITFPGIGTPFYRAPEVYKQAHLNGQQRALWTKADVFSFAITCVHLLTLRRPFEEYSTLVTQLYKALVDGVRPDLPENLCPEELRVLLTSCWKLDPRTRPSALDICVRLETYRYNLSKASPATSSNVHQGESLEFIGSTMKEHFTTSVQRPIVQDVPVEDTILPEETILTRMYSILELLRRVFLHWRGKLGSNDTTS